MRRFHQGLCSYLVLKGGRGGGGGGGVRFRHLVPAVQEGTHSSSGSVQHHHRHNSHRQQVASYSSSSSVRPPWFSPTSMLFYPGRTLLSSSSSSSSSFSSVSSATAAAATEPPISKDLLPKEVVLYQYEACPFCNKIKAFLDYYNIPYKVVEVNPLSKKEIKWSDYKKVPILMVDGEQMVDSSEIIDKLGHRLLLHPENKNYYVESQRVDVDDDNDNDNEETKWRRWVDNHLVHILSPNIYRSTTEALESFDYITSNGNFSFMERITVKYAGAAAMYFVSKKLKKKHNIIDERAALYEAAETWVNALDGREFLGGSQPNLGDLAVFGVLRPIRYLRSGRDMVDHTRICEWYTRMEKAVGESSRINA